MLRSGLAAARLHKQVSEMQENRRSRHHFYQNLHLNLGAMF